MKIFGLEMDIIKSDGPFICSVSNLGPLESMAGLTLR